MKNLMLILFLAVISQKGMTQNIPPMNHSTSNQALGRVPPSTMQTFQKDNPHTRSPQWQHLGSVWVATFQDQDQGGKEVNIYYDSLGHQLERRTILKKQEIPSALDEQIQSRYHTSDYQIVRIEPAGQSAVYQVALNLKNGRTVIYTNEQGGEIPYKDPYQ